MGIGTSIFLLAVGAILAFAVTDAISGVDLTTVGYILMAAGVLGLLFTTLVMNRRPRTVVREPVARERDVL
ncbi:MAG TPA: DUF6458 family protein [Solirubrobacteraceae bacterium]|nr:DUF6458 family protein [Solirubrobacteraceae bacterium]